MLNILITRIRALDCVQKWSVLAVRASVKICLNFSGPLREWFDVRLFKFRSENCRYDPERIQAWIPQIPWRLHT